MVGVVSEADFVRRAELGTEKPGSHFVHALALFLCEPSDQALISDDEIKQRIRAQMQAQLWAPTASVDTVVKDGVVDLHGVLRDERVRNAINALVENVEGVRTVHDFMVLAEPVPGP